MMYGMRERREIISTPPPLDAPVTAVNGDLWPPLVSWISMGEAMWLWDIKTTLPYQGLEHAHRMYLNPVEAWI